MHDLGQDQLRLCYSEFRKHCIQRHDLQEWDTTSQVHWDLENWLLTLIRHSGSAFFGKSEANHRMVSACGTEVSTRGRLM